MPAIAAITILRPHQWPKNTFVFAGFLFSAQRTTDAFLSASIGFTIFCLLSSSVYCLNDIIDRDKDRAHAVNKRRPIASGALSITHALSISGFCFGSALALSLFLSPRAVITSILYLGLNIAYSFHLKQRVLVDVFCLAFGFMLRIVMGTWALGIPPSEWILLCTFSLSLFLGFSKRYAEMEQSRNNPDIRKVLVQYSPELLRLLLAVTLSASIVLYALYTTSPRTIAQHQTGHLIYTLPIVIFGLFRYLFLVIRNNGGQDTINDILRDPQLIVTCFFYCAVVLFLIL